MKRWGLRHKGFRIGFIGVVVCSIFFMIGFIAPAWRNNTTGLWITCSPSLSLCTTTSNSNHHGSQQLPAWFEGVRAFQCLGLIAIFFCIAAEIYMDFITRTAPDLRLVELSALVAGTCSLVGCIMFAAFTPVSFNHNHYYSVYLGWGFGLAAASSCFLIIFASVIAFFRRKGLDTVRHSNSANNAVHYRASDGIVTPRDLNGMDVGPPAYSEVVNQPVQPVRREQGPPGVHAQYNYFKPPTPPDSQPPPAYYPPPPGGQFQAPPPYSVIPADSVQSVGSGDSLPSSGLESLGQPSGVGSGNAVPSEMNSEMTQNNSRSNTDDFIATNTVSTTSDSEPGSISSDPSTTRTPALSSVPAYYITVFGQMVPVFREELQQAGRDVPSAGSPVPAYFIVTQGQHVPVYSEEQARALAN